METTEGFSHSPIHQQLSRSCTHARQVEKTSSLWGLTLLRVRGSWERGGKLPRKLAAGGKEKQGLKYTCQVQGLTLRYKWRMSSRTSHQTIKKVKTSWVPFRVKEILEASEVALYKTIRVFIVGSGH